MPLQQDHAEGPTVTLGGGAVSYEQDNPVPRLAGPCPASCRAPPAQSPPPACSCPRSAFRSAVPGTGLGVYEPSVVLIRGSVFTIHLNELELVNWDSTSESDLSSKLGLSKISSARFQVSGFRNSGERVLGVGSRTVEGL